MIKMLIQTSISIWKKISIVNEYMDASFYERIRAKLVYE
jgi:hypothetical protein